MERPRFEIADCPAEAVEILRREFGVSGPLAQILVRRGLAEPALARAFLAADEEHSPMEFAGIERAIEPILRYARSGARITIHGDYDVDGICSTAVLVRSLRRLGANVDWYLPDRATDGYGLSLLTVQRLAARGTRLLVTADCAITAVAEVAQAKTLGIEVVVTDHHSPRADGVLPDAPIVHPAVCGYPCPDLCATAVAYKLAQALEHAAAAATGTAAGAKPDAGFGDGGVSSGRALEEDLDLVALATIADVVSLTGENRTLVRRGLRALAGTAKPGLRALMSVARVDPGKLNERSVAFALAPRLNAAGRLYRADAGLELVLTEDPLRAAQVADELSRANHERRQVEMRIRYEAEAQVAALDPVHPRAAYVLAGEDWHAGVIGIVASRLAEHHRRPVVLIALDGELGKGSGRSIDAFDLLAGLTACGGHLRRFGGHRAAAGLEIESGRVEEFAQAFAAHAEEVLDPADTAPLERVDAVVECEELGMKLAEELLSLAPFGRGNPGVSLLVRDAAFRDPRPMGEGKHLRFTVESGGARARGVAFGTGSRLPVAEGEPAEATFTLEINEWNGVTEPRLVLRQARAAEPAFEDRKDPVEPVAVRELRPAETPAASRQEQEQEALTLFALS
ncbi:MAG TPA: single-stranded-DNA-specific exonuclease RecJ [Solirubrobacteraceae bacterium]